MTKLTPTQRDVLRLIKANIAIEGIPPTRQEICEHFSWASPNAAQTHLKALEKAGAIRLIPKISRGISVL